MINLTQHGAVQEQLQLGVVDLPQGEGSVGAYVRELLTFETLPSSRVLLDRADEIARVAADHGHDAAMIGGAPFFMGALERALNNKGIKPYYAFSMRDSIEKDGVKTSVFRHAGFVDPTTGMGYGGVL